jgi:hypothetical protein
MDLARQTHRDPLSARNAAQAVTAATTAEDLTDSQILLDAAATAHTSGAGMDEATDLAAARTPVGVAAAETIAAEMLAKAKLSEGMRTAAKQQALWDQGKQSMVEHQRALFATAAERNAALTGKTWSAAVRRGVPPPPPPPFAAPTATPSHVAAGTAWTPGSPPTVGVGESKGGDEGAARPLPDPSHTAAGAQTKVGTQATSRTEAAPDTLDSRKGGGPRNLTGMEKMRLDEEDRRLGAAIRGESSHEGRVNALTGRYGVDKAACAPDAPPDEAAIVSDITRDTDDDRSASQATMDSNDWRTVTGRVRKTRSYESTGGIVLPH